MTRAQRAIPASVYLLADNLDAILAAGEDLLRLDHDCVASVATNVGDGAFIDRIRVLEMTVAARTLQARARAIEVGRADVRCQPLVVLFVGGTVPLQEAVADLGDSTAADFQSGGDAVTYLRSRGVIAADAASVDRHCRLAIPEEFLIAERIHLGLLMDLCATFLDKLEVHYDLFEAPEDVTVIAEVQPMSGTSA